MSFDHSAFSVIVADDDNESLKKLKYVLEKEGYDVRVAFDGEQALDLCRKYLPDLLITEITLQELDGIALVQTLRADNRFDNLKILALTERSEEYTEVAAFQAGVDGYLTKPFRNKAFLKRLQKLLVRREKVREEPPVIELGTMTIDRERTKLVRYGKSIKLPKKTFELLYFLALNPDTVYSREDLLRNIWGVGKDVSKRTIDVHVRKIREKTGEDLITTIKGIGYKLRHTEEEAHGLAGA